MPRAYPFVPRRGAGSVVEDVDGNLFLDLNAGIAVASTGHAHPTVVAAVADYFRPGRTVDDLFRDCLEVVIAGAAVKAGATF